MKSREKRAVRRRSPRRSQEARERTAGRIVTIVIAFAAIALLVLLARGDTEDHARIVALVDHLLTAASAAGLTFLFGRRSPSGR